MTENVGLKTKRKQRTVEQELIILQDRLDRQSLFIANKYIDAVGNVNIVNVGVSVVDLTIGSDNKQIRVLKSKLGMTCSKKRSKFFSPVYNHTFSTYGAGMYNFIKGSVVSKRRSLINKINYLKTLLQR